MTQTDLDEISASRRLFGRGLSEAVILSAALVTVVAIRSIPPVEVFEDITAPTTTALRVGARPPAIEGLGLAQITVVFLTRVTSCDECLANIDANKRIAASCGNRNGSRVLIMSIDQPSVAEQDLKARGLIADAAWSIPRFHTIDLRNVPAVFALNADGFIVGVWDGLLTSEDESAIKDLCPSA